MRFLSGLFLLGALWVSVVLGSAAIFDVSEATPFFITVIPFTACQWGLMSWMDRRGW
jgi:hypothetical protein